MSPKKEILEPGARICSFHTSIHIFRTLQHHIPIEQHVGHNIVINTLGMIATNTGVGGCMQWEMTTYVAVQAPVSAASAGEDELVSLGIAGLCRESASEDNVWSLGTAGIYRKSAREDEG